MWTDLLKTLGPVAVGILTGAVPPLGLVGIGVVAVSAAATVMWVRWIEARRAVALAERASETFLAAMRNLKCLPVAGEVTITCGELRVVLAKLSVKSPSSDPEVRRKACRDAHTRPVTERGTAD